MQLEGGNRRNGYYPRFVGKVLPHPQGSRIVGEFGATLPTWIGNGIWIVWGTFIAYLAHTLFFFFFAIIGGAFMFAWGVRTAEPWRTGILEIVESTVRGRTIL